MSTQNPEILSSTNPTHVSSTCKGHNLTPDEFATLSRRATDAKQLAYCPYSRFRVGASVLTADGSFVTGCNVENASYPVGTCAERVALGRAVVGLGRWRSRRT
jgi:cytidine deaminase